jgi:hypothetical protein
MVINDYRQHRHFGNFCNQENYRNIDTFVTKYTIIFKKLMVTLITMVTVVTWVPVRMQVNSVTSATMVKLMTKVSVVTKQITFLGPRVWAGHVAPMGEERGVHRVLVGKPEGKRPLGRPRRRWEDNIKMDLQEVGGGRGDWMELAQDRNRWQALVGTVRDFRVP